MKTNAIIRIVIYSLVALLLVGALLVCLGMGNFQFQFNLGGNYNTGSGSADAQQISKLDLDWAAGSITIQVADTDKITFTESGNFEDDQAMAYQIQGDTLSIQYSKPSVQIGFISTPSKDLTITVPAGWVCKELDLDGAALEIRIDGITVGALDMDGADTELTFSGALETLECDGAACELELNCTNQPKEIELNGANCTAVLTLPKDCGFRVEMDGLDCDFHSDLPCSTNHGSYVYGDGACFISANGLACRITIKEAS